MNMTNTAPSDKPIAEITFVIPSCLSSPDAVCADISKLLGERGAEFLGFEIGLVTRECLNNAIVHGNGCQADKKVRVEITLSSHDFRLTVTDEGQGFDWRTAKLTEMPEEWEPCGRGLPLIASHAQRVAFNGKGNQITVWMKLANQGR
jgi:serine/threonine-protein kinase RsbW